MRRLAAPLVATPAARTRPPRLNRLAQALMGACLLGGPVLAGLTAQALAQTPAVVLPRGLQVVSGQAQLATQGAQMTVRNTPGAILNWQSFSIGAGAGVYFDQASAASKVLNRVTGNDPSQILGRLSSNGQVWLLNPHGVLFGQGARVDVASLVTSTLRLADSDFLTGRYRFTGDTGSTAWVRNEGALQSSFGGQILLLGEQVHNSGTITAPGGQVGLAAARSVDLVDTGLPNLAVRVQVPAGEVLNLGRLVADGGRVDVHGAIVNQAGLVQANTLGLSATGEVVLRASDTLTLGAASTTQAAGTAEAGAAGAAAGRVSLDAGTLAHIGGQVLASSAQGQGGDVLVQGRHVLLGTHASLDASGATGGGRVRVGGGLQGKDAAVRHADKVAVAAGARLAADATQSGNGGQVVVWSDQATRFAGAANARGGAQGGNGGLVEVSSKGYLDFRGQSDRTAPRGRDGTLLLDPTNLSINAANPDINDDGFVGDDLNSPLLAFADPGGNSVITAAAVDAQLASGGVTLQATNNLSVNAAINGAFNGLTLQAGNDIIVNAPINLGTGSLALSANDPNGFPSGFGAVTLNAPITAGSLFATNGGGSGSHTFASNITTGTLDINGNVTLGAANTWTLQSGTSVISNIISGTGSLTLAGPGTLELGAPNSYSGGTTVDAGTLRLNNSGAVAGTGNIALNAGATLDLTGNAVVNNTLILSGGTVSNSLGAGTVNGAMVLVSDSTFTSDGSGLAVAGGVGGGAGIITGGTGTVTLGGVNTYGGNTSVGSGLLVTAASNTLPDTTVVSVAGTATLSLGGSDTAASLVLAGTISGEGTFTAATYTLNGGTVTSVGLGAGVLTSTGSSTITTFALADTVDVTGGTLTLGSANVLADTAAVTVATGAALVLGGSDTVGTLTLAGTLGGTGTLTASTYTMQPGAVTIADLGVGTLVVNGATSLNGTAQADFVQVNSGATLTLGTTDRLSDTAAVAVASGASLVLNGSDTVGTLSLAGTLGGAGTLAANASTLANGAVLDTTLAGANVTATGLVTVNAALSPTTLTVDSGSFIVNVGNALSSATTLVVNGGFFDMGSNASSVGGVVLAGGTIRGEFNALVDYDLRNGEFLGVMGGTVGAVKSTAGTVVITGANTYAGLTTIVGGTLAVGNGGTFGVLPPTDVINNGILRFARSDAIIFPNNISGAGAVEQNSPGATTLTGNNGYSGTTLVAAGTLVGGSTGSLSNFSDFAVSSGATLELSAAGGVNSLLLAGTLQGSGTLAVAGNVALVGGNVNSPLVAGTLTSEGNSVLRANVALDVSAAVNNGVLTVGDGAVSGALVITSPVVIAAGAVLAFDRSDVVTLDSTAGTGTLRQAGPGELQITGSVNASTVEVNGGTLALAVGSPNRLTDTTTVSVVSGATLRLDNGTETVGALNLSGSLDGAGATLTAATTTLNGGAVHANLGAGSLVSLGSSTLVGTADVSSVNVLAGTLTLDSAGRLAVAPAMNVDGGAALSLGGNEVVGGLTGAGTVHLGGATLAVSLSGAGSFAGSIDGSGGLIKQGAGTFSLSGVQSYSGGTTVDGGTLATLASNLLPDTSAVAVNSGATLSLGGDDTVGSLALLGTLSGSGTLSAASYTTGFGAVIDANLGAGTLVVSGDTALNGTAAVSAVDVSTGVLTLGSAGRWTGLPAVNVGTDSAMDLSADEALGSLAGQGTVTVSAGTLTTGSAGNSTFAGTLVGAGGLTKVGASTFTLGGSNVYTGLTTIADGTLDVAVDTSLASLTMTGGTLAGTGNVTVTGPFDVTGASAALVGTGSFTTQAGSTINLAQANGSLDVARPWVNNGTLAVAGDDYLRLDGSTGGSLTNALGGVVNLSTSFSFAVRTLAGAPAVSNQGTLNHNGSGTVSLQAGSFDNTGTVAVNAGTLVINAAGTDTGAYNLAAGAGVAFATGPRVLGAGASVAGNGKFEVSTGTVDINTALTPGGVTFQTSSGTLNFNDVSPITVANLTHTGGTIGGVGDVVVTGQFNAIGTSGNLAGAGTLTTGGTSTVNLSSVTGGTLAVEKPWLNAGTLAIGGDDRLSVAAATGALTNTAAGTINLVGTDATPITGTGAFSNAGTLNKLTAATQVVSSGVFSNTGTVDVQAGTLGILNAASHTGTLKSALGTTLELPDGFVNAAGATISGDGTVVVGGGTGTLNNDGDISPATVGTVGTLSISGNLVQGATGRVAVDLGGTGAGASDLLAVSGSISLGGTLDTTLLPIYNPADADFVPVISVGGTAAGGFALTNNPAGFAAGYNLAAGEAVRLIYSTSGFTKIFTNAAGNLDWGTPANWGGALPGASDTALISAGFAVDHNRGSTSIAGLTVNGANSLSVSGGTLSVSGDTSLGGSFTVSGTGTATLGGNVTGGGTVAVSGGTLTLGGAASLGGLNLTGGLLDGTGALSVAGSFARTGAAAIGSGFSSISVTQATGNLVPGAMSAGRILLATQDTASTLVVDGLLQAGADVQLAGSGGVRLLSGGAISSAAAGDAVVIDAGTGPFDNQAGAGALSAANGRWLVYSANPANDTVGGLPATFRQLNAPFGTTPQGAGSGLLYSQAATLTASLQGSVSKVYDRNTAATVAPANYVVSGALATDLVVLNNPSAGTYTTAGTAATVQGAGTGKAVLVTGVTASVTDSATGIPVYGYQFDGTASGVVGGITPLTLVPTGSLVASKVYDGNTLATVSNVGSVAPLAGDTVGLAASGATFADKNVGTTKPVTLSGLVLTGADAANYTLQAPTGLTADITSRALPVAGLAASNKVYDANTVAALSGTAAINPVVGDTVNLQGTATGAFADKNVGNAKPVSVGGLSITGADAGNYTLQAPASLVADITVLNLPLTGLGASNKVYDANTVATLTGTAAISPLAGDTVNLLGTAAGAFATKNVGTAKPVAVSGLTLGGADAANYALQAPTGLTADITALALPVAGLAANNKVYDANTVAVLSGTAAINPLAGDTVSLLGTAAGAFATKNVGTAKPVAVSGLTLGGADAANYALQLPASLVADINALALTVTGLSANNKVYDANTAATLAGTAAVVPLAGDVVNVAGTSSATFADKNVGTAKAVSVAGLSLAGADAANYTLQAPTGLTADITALALPVTGLAANNKVYDANTVAVLSGTAAINPLAGDTVSLLGTAAGTFADKNVGNAKPVSVGGLSITGADAGNYSLRTPTALQATITPAPLPVTGLSVQGKTYDTTNVATLAGTAAVAPLGSDVVTLGGTPDARFADKNVGTAKAVSVSGYVLSGADAGNYTLQVPTGLQADINAATLALVGLQAADKVYDGTTSANASATLGGVLGADQVNLGLLAQFADAGAGVAKAVNVTAQITGADATNYALAGNPFATTATINLATLRWVAAPASGVSGGVLPVLTGTVAGFVNGETVDNATTGTLQWTTPANSSSPAGSYAVLGGGLVAANYRFEQDAANASALTLTAATTNDVSTNATSTGIASALAAVTIVAQTSTPSSGRVLDAVQALTPTTPTPTPTPTTEPAAEPASEGSTPAATATAAATATTPPPASAGYGYRPMNFSLMSREDIQGLLAARAGHKQKVLSTTIDKLEQDPSLADVRGCANEAELATGNCLITDALKQEIQAKAARATVKPAPRSKRKLKQVTLPNIERKLALLIGINNYADKRIPQLAGAVPDTRAVRDVLESRMGYEATLVPDASREGIIRAFNKLALEADGNDSVIIYYAGHGVVLPAEGGGKGSGNGFWLPADSDAETPQTWISNADISRLVSLVGSRQLMLVSDSCYSGNLAGSEKVQVDGKAEAADLLSRRAAVVMSSGGDEPVADEGRNGHSVFAWHLMQSLGEVTQWQTGSAVFGRVQAAVRKDFPQTPQYGAARSAGHQGNTDYLFERREFDGSVTP